MWLMGGHFHTRGRHGAFIQICCGKPTQVVGGEQEEDSNPADSVSARLEAYEYVSLPLEDVMPRPLSAPSP